jgi:hypothetical protein
MRSARRLPSSGPRAAPFLILAVAIAASASGAEPGCDPRRRALVIGIDGARGDVLDELVWERGGAPALRDLMARGAYARCPEARSPECARAHPGPRRVASARWVTAPGWAAALSGVDSLRHEVHDNSLASLARYEQTSRRFPSFLMRARGAGLVTAAGGVGAFLSSTDGGGLYPGVLDFECAQTGGDLAAVAARTASCNLTHRLPLDSRDPDRDAKLAAWMARKLAEPDTDVIMGVLDQVDEAGHRFGFGGSRYAAAFTRTDALIGPLVAELERGVRERCEAWLVIVTADHGGHRRLLFGGEHGRRAGADDAIPFVVSLLGAERARPLAAPATQMDTHPTVARWLGLPLAPDLDGRVQGIPEEAQLELRGSPGRSRSVKR